MTPTPATVAKIRPPRPFYVRNATTHTDLPERYQTQAEALERRAELARSDRRGHLFIVKDRRTA